MLVRGRMPFRQSRSRWKANCRRSPILPAMASIQRTTRGLPTIGRDRDVNFIAGGAVAVLGEATRRGDKAVACQFGGDGAIAAVPRISDRSACRACPGGGAARPKSRCICRPARFRQPQYNRTFFGRRNCRGRQLGQTRRPVAYRIRSGGPFWSRRLVVPVAAGCCAQRNGAVRDCRPGRGRCGGDRGTGPRRARDRCLHARARSGPVG